MRDGTKTKEKIDRTALELFVKKGIKETTIKDISAATGLSEGAMYRHYSSKDELAEELFSENYIEFAEELEEICRSNKSLKKQISAMIGRYCEAFDNDPVLYSYLLLSQHDELKRLRTNEINLVKILNKVLSEAIKNNEIPKIDPAFGTAQIMGVVLETAKFVIYGRIKGKMSDYSEELSKSCYKIFGIK